MLTSSFGKSGESLKQNNRSANSHSTLDKLYHKTCWISLYTFQKTLLFFTIQSHNFLFIEHCSICLFSTWTALFRFLTPTTTFASSFILISYLTNPLFEASNRSFFESAYCTMSRVLEYLELLLCQICPNQARSTIFVVTCSSTFLGSLTIRNAQSRKAGTVSASPVLSDV